jgi:hypothetical protein
MKPDLLSYRTTIKHKIGVLIPEYQFREKMGEFVERCNEADLNYLYALIVQKKVGELSKYIKQNI